jgi:hypothetical protein
MLQPEEENRDRQEAFHDRFTIGHQIVLEIQHPTTGGHIMSGSDTFRITLTPEQKEQVRKATGKEANTIELTAEELEERIAPMTIAGKRRAYPS